MGSDFANFRDGCHGPVPLQTAACFQIKTGAKAPQTTPRKLELLTASPLASLVLVGSNFLGNSWVKSRCRLDWTRSLPIRCDTLASMGLLRHSSYQVINPREE